MACRRVSASLLRPLKKPRGQERPSLNQNRRSLTSRAGQQGRPFLATTAVVVGVGGALVGSYILHEHSHHATVEAAKDVRKPDVSGLSRREQRFHDFASCEGKGQYSDLHRKQWMVLFQQGDANYA